MQLKENSHLQSGKYRIIRVLGQGGFGITYLAENIMLGKQVAIKEFFPKDFCGRDNTSHLTLGTQNNAETVSKLKNRFLKEAQNIAKLDHPGIVRIHDIFEENNTAYYVMDFIDGENLNEMVKRNGPLSEEKAVEYISKVGDALDYIHSRNMTHFDVKPANIVVRKKDDQPILIDFGLSKQYDIHGDATSTLMQGISHGYSPIELYNYGAISSFSPQTDVYSLAATLLYLISGNVPPQPSTIIEEGLDLTSVSDPNLKEAIEEAMQVGRGKRPKTIYGFLDGINSSATTHSTSIKSSQSDSESLNEETTFMDSNNSQNETFHSASNFEGYYSGIPKTQDISKKEKINIRHVLIGLFILLIFGGIWAIFSLNPTNYSGAKRVAEKINMGQDSLTQADCSIIIDYFEAYAKEMQPLYDKMEGKDSIEMASKISSNISNKYEYLNLFLENLPLVDHLFGNEDEERIQKLSKEYSCFPIQFFGPENPKEIFSFSVEGMGVCDYYGDINAQGKPDGWGKATFSKGVAASFDGFWSDGIPDGDGSYKLANGDTFFGNFIGGKYNHGTYTVKSTGEYFVGAFSNGVPSSGRWYDKNGNVLETIN